MYSSDELDKRLAAARLFYSKCWLYASHGRDIDQISKTGEKADHDHEITAYITTLYGESCARLLRRHSEIVDKYLGRRKVAKYFIIVNADRTDKSVADSVHYFKNDIAALLLELLHFHSPRPIVLNGVTQPAPPLMAAGALKQNCFPRWDVLERQSELLMAEISFLSKRVDEIANIIISLVAQILTLIALFLAILGLFLSTAGTGFDVYDFFTSKDSENISAIRETVVGPPSTSQTNNSNFKQLSDKIYNLNVSFENFSLKQDGPFQSLVSELKKVSQDNEKLKTDFSDILKSRPPNITVSPNINVTVPEQKPSVKANGLINVNSH